MSLDWAEVDIQFMRAALAAENAAAEVRAISVGAFIEVLVFF